MVDPSPAAVPDLADVPGLPRDADGAVFSAPWEAKAFALVVLLHQRGHFQWQAWVQALAAEIAQDRSRTQETPYYLLWLTAAEQLVTARGLLDAEQLATLRTALHAAQAGHHDHHHDHHTH
jgi:nitrile hydratase accessory protein